MSTFAAEALADAKASDRSLEDVWDDLDGLAEEVDLSREEDFESGISESQLYE
jgi:hypothetical protein